MQIFFFISIVGPDPQTFFNFEQHKYQIQKEYRSFFCVAKMFFIQSRQMKVYGYTGV